MIAANGLATTNVEDSDVKRKGTETVVATENKEERAVERYWQTGVSEQMGRPEADSSSSYDESVQPREHQYEQTQGDFSAHAYETSYDDPSQSHPALTVPTPRPTNQSDVLNWTKSARAIPATSKPNAARAIPAQFPPQNPMEPAAYPPQGPQTFPNQPAELPPKSPQMNPIPQISNHNALNQCPSHFHHKAFQNPYQAPPAQAQPLGGQFPPTSPVNGTPVAPVNQQQQAWTTGIFDCLEDPSNGNV
uniref:Uncharacterized protein n=1 Tax=Salix viminalis TaxID=40686 RepID=A0A6N2LLG9_SALVM